jgi:hypothetical protein
MESGGRMKRVIFIGEDHVCGKCVNEEIEYSKDFTQIGVELIGYTERNFKACDEFNGNGSNVSQFITKLDDYRNAKYRSWLEIHSPLFRSAREEDKKILPFRPEQHEHWIYFPAYVKNI